MAYSFVFLPFCPQPENFSVIRCERQSDRHVHSFNGLLIYFLPPFLLSLKYAAKDSAIFVWDRDSLVRYRVFLTSTAKTDQTALVSTTTA